MSFLRLYITRPVMDGCLGGVVRKEGGSSFVSLRRLRQELKHQLQSSICIFSSAKILGAS